MLATVVTIQPKAVFMPVEVTENQGAYPNLAKTARHLTGGLSSRVLARKTGLSYDTIQRILNGDRPKADTILKFAAGCRLDEEQTSELMAAADYGYLTPNRQTPEITTGGELGSTTGKIERFPDSQEPEESPLRARMMAAFDQLPMRLKQLEVEQAEALLEEMYRGRKDIVGKQAE